MKERTLCRSAPKFNDVCQCIYEWSDEELEDLSDDDFEDLPCVTCGGCRGRAGTRLDGGRGRLLMRPRNLTQSENEASGSDRATEFYSR